MSEPDETRRGFLTYAEVRRTLDADPAWESTPHADLQMHTTWSDGACRSRRWSRPRDPWAGRSCRSPPLKALAIATACRRPSSRSRAADRRDEPRVGREGDAFRVLVRWRSICFPTARSTMTTPWRAHLVLGAFHSESRSKDDQTERYLAALRQPQLHVLAHPKARMYGRRVGLVADWRRVFAEAAIQGKALELDATVPRQDLNVELATLAREEGVEWFTIGSDAHSAPELEFLPFGMAIAALAGIPRERILNYRPIGFVRAWAHARGASVI